MWGAHTPLPEMKGNLYWRKKTEISKKMWGTVSKRQRGTMKTTFIKGSKILGPWEQPSSAQTWEMELCSFSFSMKAAHNILKLLKLLLGSG